MEVIDPIAEYLAADYDPGKDDCMSVGIPTINDFLHCVASLIANLTSKTFGHVQLVSNGNNGGICIL